MGGALDRWWRAGQAVVVPCSFITSIALVHRNLGDVARARCAPLPPFLLLLLLPPGYALLVISQKAVTKFLRTLLTLMKAEAVFV